MNIVGIIKDLQQKKDGKVSLNKLEKELGFGKSTVASWENKKPASDKLEKLADYFGVSVDYLLGRTDNPALYEVDTVKPSERAQAEAEFLAAFEKLTDKQKAIALGYMERMAEENNQK